MTKNLSTQTLTTERFEIQYINKQTGNNVTVYMSNEVQALRERRKIKDAGHKILSQLKTTVTEDVTRAVKTVVFR